MQLSHEVWPEIRKSIHEENDDAYILAEDWGDCAEYLQGKEWDLPMNYYGCARVILQFTLIGAASIYYGDEAGIDGTIFTNEGCRYPMTWSRDFPVPKFKVAEEPERLEIITEKLHLYYDKKAFPPAEQTMKQIMVLFARASI